MLFITRDHITYNIKTNSISFYIFHSMQDPNYYFQLHIKYQTWSTINNENFATKILQKTNFNIINILVNILKLVTKIFMVLKLAFCNVWVIDFFNYLLLIMFNNEFVIEKSNLNLILNNIYKMIYYFLIAYVIWSLIINNTF